MSLWWNWIRDVTKTTIAPKICDLGTSIKILVLNWQGRLDVKFDETGCELDGTIWEGSSSRNWDGVYGPYIQATRLYYTDSWAYGFVKLFVGLACGYFGFNEHCVEKTRLRYCRKELLHKPLYFSPCLKQNHIKFLN